MLVGFSAGAGGAAGGWALLVAGGALEAAATLSAFDTDIGPQQQVLLLPRGDVPQADGPIGAAGRQRFAVVSERQGADVILVARERADDLAGRRIPQRHGASRFIVDRGQQLAGRRELDAIDQAIGSLHFVSPNARGQVPEGNRVFAIGGQRLAVGRNGGRKNNGPFERCERSIQIDRLFVKLSPRLHAPHRELDPFDFVAVAAARYQILAVGGKPNPKKREQVAAKGVLLGLQGFSRRAIPAAQLSAPR